MARKRNGMTRGEVEAKVEHHREEVSEKTEQLDKDVNDVETERTTLDGLELEGTSEAAETVERALQEAEKASQQEFSGHSQELEHLHEGAGADQKDLQERSDSTDQDARRIEGAGEKIQGDAARNELEEARDSARRDIEFLQEHIDRLRQALDESDRRHQEQQSRVNAGGRS